MFLFSGPEKDFQIVILAVEMFLLYIAMMQPCEWMGLPFESDALQVAERDDVATISLVGLPCDAENWNYGLLLNICHIYQTSLCGSYKI